MSGYSFHFAPASKSAPARAVSGVKMGAIAPPPPGSSPEAFQNWARNAEGEIEQAEFMITSLGGDLERAQADRDSAQAEMDRIAAEIEEWRTYAEQWRQFAEYYL